MLKLVFTKMIYTRPLERKSEEKDLGEFKETGEKQNKKTKQKKTPLSFVQGRVVQISVSS